jgi:acyl-CoA dehydrogenase
MDFTMSATAADLLERTRTFMTEHVYPAEAVYAEQRSTLIQQGTPHAVPQILLDLQQAARTAGLWNLFLPSQSGLSNVDYAVIAEETGRSPFLAPAVMNSLSPDSGNMELLDMFASDEQRATWLAPLLDGSIRSAFCMTEPDVASSDATNISTSIRREGDEYVINGRKWWSTGVGDPRTRLLIVMGKTDPRGPVHRQQSMVLVPIDAPGVTVVRTLPVYGYEDQQGHGEVLFEDVRVPVANVLRGEGEGFGLAQARLGPGRVHHCMRAIGMAERALELTCRRSLSRVAFGGQLADQGVVRERIALARIDIEQVRLLVLKTAWLIDNLGAKAARTEIAAIKVAAPRVAVEVIDQAIQLHGGAGVSDDTPLAAIWSRARTLRIVDGPDDVHLRTVGERELRKYRAVSQAR